MNAVTPNGHFHTIGIVGLAGRMGQGLAVACAKTFPFAKIIGYDQRCGEHGQTMQSLAHLWQQSCIVLDFSHSSLFDEVMAAALESPKPYILGTSDIADHKVHVGLEALADFVPVLWAPNTCLGAVVQRWMARKIAAVFPSNYDIDIVDVHHRGKRDAPSGTALALAKSTSEGYAQQEKTPLSWGLATSPRSDNRIEMHAMRISHTPCQHRVMWTSPMEALEITHTAFSREALVEGAVDLISWLLSHQRVKGSYTVEDRWGLI